MNLIFVPIAPYSLAVICAPNAGAGHAGLYGGALSRVCNLASEPVERSSPSGNPGMKSKVLARRVDR